MFRTPTQIDPIEEKKRVKADVRNNVIMFTILCVAIRLAPILLGRTRII